MVDFWSLIDRLRAALLPGFCALLISLCALHALTGQHGLLAYGKYVDELAALEGPAEEIAQQRAALQHKVDLLDPRGADPDYVDELVRKGLGYVRPDEDIVPLR